MDNDSDAARLVEAQARLWDIAAGAEMMLQPIMGLDKLPQWVQAYIREVKRVASAPL